MININGKDFARSDIKTYTMNRIDPDFKYDLWINFKDEKLQSYYVGLYKDQETADKQLHAIFDALDSVETINIDDIIIVDKI